MLGLYSSISTVITLLKMHSITNYAVTEFIQGSRTRRWGIAWSFGDWSVPFISSRSWYSYYVALFAISAQSVVPVDQDRNQTRIECEH